MDPNCDRWLMAALIVVAASICAMAADPAGGSVQGKPAATAPTLDQRLSDELDRELLQDLPGAARSEGQPAGVRKPAEKSRGRESDLDRQLLDQLREGEDLGEKSPDPFLTVSRRMRTVEERISQKDTAEATQRLQQQIVSDLALLIEQAKKQCSGGQCNKPGAAKPGGKPGGNKKGGTGDNAGTQRSAKDSTERLGKSAATVAELEAMKTMFKEVWGQLPPKLREQMQSGLAEQFLPKYETLIEAYYKRLAEDRIE